MNKRDLETARTLYRPTPKVEGLVCKIIDLFDKPLSNGVTIKDIEFKKGHLKLGGLDVKSINRVNAFYWVEIHWYPDFNISTTSDPYCTLYALKYNSLQKLYREVEKVLTEMSK